MAPRPRRSERSTSGSRTRITRSATREASSQVIPDSQATQTTATPSTNYGSVAGEDASALDARIQAMEARNPVISSATSTNYGPTFDNSESEIRAMEARAQLDTRDRA